MNVEWTGFLTLAAAVTVVLTGLFVSYNTRDRKQLGRGLHLLGIAAGRQYRLWSSPISLIFAMEERAK